MFELLPGYLFTAAFIWLLTATAWRIASWVTTPLPLPIPLAPTPRTHVGVAGRLLLECFTFRSLARANKTTWAASLIFHYGLLLVLIVHLRFVLPQFPLWLLPFIRLSGWATTGLLLGLIILLIRRIVVDRLRYISAPSDYLHLLLLLTIAGSGAALKRLWSTELHAVGEFLRGALTFDWQALPAHAGLWLHLAPVLLLIAIFPISKLLHGAGVLLSPTFNQRDPNA
ncbi:respiratory nitrate reductase subunit gamma [Granulosicoccus antarcticus]|uniref:respiratory nitrate reductase subunit gamma n=1 Tax=Granulosicoccus antarcticus TaxID=437505 RepID=UPI0012FDF24E|nr:respiratory nitrate reductase subunit gamma [Granulosicoccus antarcticus]